MYINVAYDIMYHRARREVDMTSASYSKKTTQHGGTSVAALSWLLALVCGVVCAGVPYALCRGLDICGGISSRTGYAILISS